MGHVKHPALHLLQELAQIVMVKGKSTLQKGKKKSKGKNCDTLNLKKMQDDKRTTLKGFFQVIKQYCGKDLPPREQRG